MKIERSVHNDIPADEAYAMSVDKVYQERKCQDAGALSWSIRIEDGADGATVSTRRKLPTTGFPALLRRFVPSGVTSTETVVWGPAQADGGRTATLSVDFHGSPAVMKGTVRIIPDGDTASTVVVEAVFKAHVPIIAGKIEGFAAPIILNVIDSEERTARAWVAERR